MSIAVSVSDILKVKDPLSSCKVGLLLKKSNISIPLKAVHVFVKMIDLVAEVRDFQELISMSHALLSHSCIVATWAMWLLVGIGAHVDINAILLLRKFIF